MSKKFRAEQRESGGNKRLGKYVGHKANVKCLKYTYSNTTMVAGLKILGNVRGGKSVNNDIKNN